MASKFNASHFIRKFRAIPDANWTTGAFHHDGQSCALGHLGAIGDNHEEKMALVYLFAKYLHASPTQINDGDDVRFKQSTPKQRVLAALRNILALRLAK